MREKLISLKQEYSKGTDKQGQVLTPEERILALTHIVQQEFIFDNHTIQNLALLRESIKWSVFNEERFAVLDPAKRRSLLISVVTYGLLFFASSQDVGVAEGIKQQWINQTSVIADKVEEGVNVSDSKRLPFYDLRDSFFTRGANFIVGFGIQNDPGGLHLKVLTGLNNTNYLMHTRLGYAYDELNEAFGMSELVTKLNTQRTESAGFNQANQLKMVEMLFKFYQRVAF